MATVQRWAYFGRLFMAAWVLFALPIAFFKPRVGGRL
jgi:hypothetical protein